MTTWFTVIAEFIALIGRWAAGAMQPEEALRLIRNLDEEAKKIDRDVDAAARGPTTGAQ